MADEIARLAQKAEDDHAREEEQHRRFIDGYSDLAAIVGSINDGEVYRFISKPWDNQELQSVLAEAVAIGAKMLDRNRTQLTPPESVDAAILVLDDDGVVLDSRFIGPDGERLASMQVAASDWPAGVELTTPRPAAWAGQTFAKGFWNSMSFAARTSSAMPRSRSTVVSKPFLRIFSYDTS